MNSFNPHFSMGCPSKLLEVKVLLMAKKFSVLNIVVKPHTALLVKNPFTDETFLNKEYWKLPTYIFLYTFK